MLIAAALMIIFCKTKPSEAVDGSVFKSGLVAVAVSTGICLLLSHMFFA